MISKIRGLVYKLGFRPKPGSVFFSPTRAFEASYKEAVKNIKIPVLTVYGEGQKLKRLPESCPTCNGWIWNGNQWVKARETVGLICPSCRTDYGSDNGQSHPGSTLPSDQILSHVRRKTYLQLQRWRRQS